MNSKTRKKILIPVTIFIISFMLSCAANYNVRIGSAEDKFYIQNKPLEAARDLLPMMNAGGTDNMLFMLEAGVMLHAGDEYKKSTDVLMKAAQAMDSMPIVVREQAASLLLNDTFTSYRGEDFERVLVHMYLGMNFLFMKKGDEAQVEFKKVGNELNRIKAETGKDYKQNIMAKYLTGVAFEIAAEVSDSEKDRLNNLEYALIEYKQINKLKPGFARVSEDINRVSRMLDDEKKKRKANNGQFVMIFQGGRSPYKVSRGKLLSDRTMQTLLDAELRMAIASNQALIGITAAAITASLNNAENPIPKYEKRSNLIKKLRIKTGKKTLDTIVMEDITDTSLKHFEDNYGFYRKKVAAGVATKVVTSLLATIAAKEASKFAGELLKGLGGNFAKVGEIMSAGNEVIGAAAGIGTAAALINQIKPDLRCWHALPATFQIARTFLPAGDYELKIEFIDKNNRVHAVETEKITVKAGDTTFLSYRTLY
jgi:hypothetical protein